MSSKEQYKDALKRQKQIIIELSIKNKDLQDALTRATKQIIIELSIKNKDLQDALTRATKQILDFRRANIKVKTKKWWQFWK